jgi:hypothetical protein
VAGLKGKKVRQGDRRHRRDPTQCTLPAMALDTIRLSSPRSEARSIGDASDREVAGLSVTGGTKGVVAPRWAA